MHLCIPSRWRDLNSQAGILTVDPNMRNHHNEKKRSKRNTLDIIASDFGSSKQPFNKEADGSLFRDKEIESDFEWLLSYLTRNNEQTKSSTEEVIVEDENEDISEDANEKDPQYCLFLKALTKNGKSYKLKISKDDETPRFLEYEKEDNSDGFDLPTHTNIIVDSSGDKVNSSEDMGDKKINRRVKNTIHGKKRELSTTKEISDKKKKIKEHKSTPDRFNDVPSCYREFLDGCVESKYGEFLYEGKRVNYEEKPASSDSDIQIWDNTRDCVDVNNKQLMTAKKEPSLKEKLMCVLRKPYDREEYEQLSEYVEEKPICRLLPLRHRAISSALDGETKSVLDDVPKSFRRKLRAAQNDRPRVLNLLRMFRFWLEHVPNEDVFQPWLNDECLKVLPSTRR